MSTTKKQKMQRCRQFSINCRGKLLDLSKRPVVMGILNVTPDSFYDGGSYIANHDAILRRVDEILEQGAGMIDVGGYSTRPGAADVTPEEEWIRVSSALEIIQKHHPDAIVSVDTFRASVAKRSVLEGGASIINDISAGTLDADLLPVVAELNVPYILMHMQGTPETMQQNPHYEDVTKEVIFQLSNQLAEVRNLGIHDVIIDPGFGFGKTLDDNYKLMDEMDQFSVFELPILVGVSRKSMIYKLLGTSPSEALNGTSVLNTISLMKGANILRVHDVKEAVECVNIMEKFVNFA
ncbi:MAG: dihydropteroate synthase [Bacteroidales bacterium]|nr:dihydropteroate synthase [Bacteroidales bacterium]